MAQLRPASVPRAVHCAGFPIVLDSDISRVRDGFLWYDVLELFRLASDGVTVTNAGEYQDFVAAGWRALMFLLGIVLTIGGTLALLLQLCGADLAVVVFAQACMFCPNATRAKRSR